MKPLHRLSAAILGLLLVSTSASADALRCETKSALNGSAQLEVGTAWSGVNIVPAAFQSGGGRLVVAYIDQDRWLTLARADAKSGEVCQTRLSFRFPGWDSHNTISLARAPDGSVHLAVSIHDSKLFYARSSDDTLEDVTTSSVVGADEDQVTTPWFLRNAAGDLVLFYRDGKSGAGRWISDEWKDGKWRRVGEAFAEKDDRGTVSAYPSNVITQPHEASHMAIVWRRTPPDVANNFAVGYARTTDFQKWSGYFGKPTVGPVGPKQIDIVDEPGEGSGLLNSARLLLAPDHSPVIIYLRYGGNNTDAVIAARPGPKGWIRREIAVSSRRTPVGGLGTMRGLPITSAAADDRGVGWISVFFPPDERRVVRIDLMTLEQITSAPQANSNRQQDDPKPAKIPVPAGMASPQNFSRRILENGFDGAGRGLLTWYAQPSNQDQPRDCTTKEPLACDPPPSPIIWSRRSPE